MSVEITLDQLLAEYQRLGLTRDDEGLTLRELADRWGIGSAAVTNRLRIAKQAGLLVVGSKTIERLDGRRVSVPCYQIVLKKDQKKRKA